MKKTKCFTIQEAASHPGKYMICPIHDNFFLLSTKGSYNVICARLFNLSYANYLRMCRDCFGAEIVGKGTAYPIALFKRNEELMALVELLNVRANLVLWERENPAYTEHAEYVKEKNPIFYARVNNG